MTPRVGWLGRPGDTGRIEASLRLPRRIRNTTLHRTNIKTALPFNSINGSVSVRTTLVHLRGLVKCKRPIESLILPGCRNKNKRRSSNTRGAVRVAAIWQDVIQLLSNTWSSDIISKIQEHSQTAIKTSRILIAANLFRVRVKDTACNSP